MDPIILELAKLAARHKLVPFLGAGCSAPHLGVDWDSLTREMADSIGSISKNNIEVAEEFITKRGADGLADVLRSRLIAAGYEDAKGSAHLAILALGLGLIYTTNQDNLFEKCCEKYGHVWRTISQISDLAEYRPGERLYIKYHGDLAAPDSVVFATSHYQRRITDRDHFLNIRLKSDLLAKQLLFVGYSLRDDTVKLVLSEVQAVLGGKLPPSYLVAYTWTPELEAACEPLGVRVIDPSKIFPGATTKAEALDRLLTALLAETWKLKMAEEVRLAFENATPPATRIASRYEVEALKAALPALPVEEAVKKFRGIFDDVVIVKDYEEVVGKIFLDLCQRCTTEKESDDLNHAIFNLHLTDPIVGLRVCAGVMATANIRPVPTLFHGFHIVGRNGEMASILTAAMAIEILQEWGRKISEPFLHYVSNWCDHGAAFEDDLNANLQDYVRAWLDLAWKTPTVLEHPIKRQQRLAKSGLRTKAPTFSQTLENLTGVMPRRFKKPFEE